MRALVRARQGAEPCLGGCASVFGRPCFTCHQPAAADGGSTFSLALDLGNAQCAPRWDRVNSVTLSSVAVGRREHSLVQLPTRTSRMRACQRPDRDDACLPGRGCDACQGRRAQRQHARGPARQRAAALSARGACRSPPVVDRVPTMKTANCRMCLLLATGQMGMLQIEDAERLQARRRGCVAGHCWGVTTTVGLQSVECALDRGRSASCPAGSIWRSRAPGCSSAPARPSTQFRLPQGPGSTDASV